MYSHLDRDTLTSRLLNDLGETNVEVGADAATELGRFAQSVLRRADQAYLYKHRMTTLGAQLRDSFEWFVGALQSPGVEVRAFSPTTEANGYAIDGHIIESVMPDQPFIFDTLKLAMRQVGIRVMNVLHVILPVSRGDGRVLIAPGPGIDARHYSYTRWFVDWSAGIPHDHIANEIGQRLKLARAMVSDFHRMNRDIKAVANEFDYLATINGETHDGCLEVRDFLYWLIEENFVFMGLSFYSQRSDGSYEVDVARGLGSVRGNPQPSRQETDATLRALAEEKHLSWPIARLRKSSSDSVLHRAGKVDEILVRTFDTDGKAVGGILIHGMFTFKGLGEQGSAIPILRRKLARILADVQTVRSSYEHKTLVHAFNALPVEYLFEADEATIHSLLRMTVAAEDTQEIKTHIATQRDAKSAYVFVVLPHESYSDELRALLQTVLQVELSASYADYRVHLGKYESVTIHFYLTGDRPFNDLDLAGIEAKLIEIGTPWRARLKRALAREYGETQSAGIYQRYADAFPEGYTDLTSVDHAVVDIHHLEKVRQTGHARFDIFESRTRGDALLRIYSQHDLLLTDILPVVDNFGVVVVEQYSHEVTPGRTDTLTVNTLRVRRGDPDLYAQREELIGGLRAVFHDRMRSDRINRLLLKARITWREVDALRAYFHYSRQLGSQLTAEITQKVLINHSDFVSLLTQYFRSRFDPDLNLSPPMRDRQSQQFERRLFQYLDEVKGFEEDRILRMFLDLIQSTVRTNFYQVRDDGGHRLSFKIDCAQVTDMPAPRPMFEIYVHHRELEGVHLRGGRVARGGLRWSDRPDDYRSEILGLMATQMLKNTLIVPVGAKGGFVLKQAPEDWSEARAQADRLYEVFIQCLLDVTDNIVDGEVVSPERVICYDDGDPYLVVAADKGTAHLSDTANKLALRAGFWLGDAFASGGSVGYDHKEKGITALGAWVCVRRHFREMGIDPEVDEIQVVGIGDMSGDVFGNGLLCSKTIKLVAAFNHRHIFLDPDPDPAASYAERKRLFDLGRSSWANYDEALISTGGGVFERGAKSIMLKPAAKELLNTSEDEVSGEALIRLILQARVDLLWNGGIGTYVKASSETHADVGDADNDRVRVDASALRCAVVGEGGNLGMTMRARVELAERGGRVNLDAIDNSGGVDLSDHEVNLKTLLSHPVRNGTLSGPDRDALLIAVGDEVCQDVLRNNEGQSLSISLDEFRGRQDIWKLVHAMMFLRDKTGFSRRVERLPRGGQLIKQRMASEKGFLRPEIAKLLAYSKMFALAGIEKRPIADRAALRPFLDTYFPSRVLADQGDAVQHHILFNEIAATVQVNRIIDMAGITFLPTVAVATERETSDIAAAYLVAEDLLELIPLRAAIRDNRKLSTEAQYAALTKIEYALLTATRALLWAHPGPVTLASAQHLSGVKDVVKAIAKALHKHLPDHLARALKDDAVQLRSLGISATHAKAIAKLHWLDHAFAIEQLMREASLDVPAAVRGYLQAGSDTHLLELVQVMDAQSYPDRWDQLAVHTLTRTLLASVRRVARLRAERGDRDIQLDAIPQQISDLMRERIPVSAMLVVSERVVQRLERLEASDEAPPAMDKPSSAA